MPSRCCCPRLLTPRGAVGLRLRVRFPAKLLIGWKGVQLGGAAWENPQRWRPQGRAPCLPLPSRWHSPSHTVPTPTRFRAGGGLEQGTESLSPPVHHPRPLPGRGPPLAAFSLVHLRSLSGTWVFRVPAPGAAVWAPGRWLPTRARLPLQPWPQEPQPPRGVWALSCGCLPSGILVTRSLPTPWPGFSSES